MFKSHVSLRGRQSDESKKNWTEEDRPHSHEKREEKELIKREQCRERKEDKETLMPGKFIKRRKNQEGVSFFQSKS